MKPNLLLGRRMAPPPRAPQPAGILDDYVTACPEPQQALDIFRGQWSSALPQPLSGCRAGKIPLFADPRIDWWLSESGGVAGRSVLELGPLEAGHSYMLQRAGAAEVLAIEANTRAYLKCLVIKELLGLDRVRFHCGDFVAWMRREERGFEMVLASGVLYHMQNPVELIALLGRRCTRSLFLWTHYYDRSIIADDPNLAPRFTVSSTAEFEGFAHTLHRQEYQGSLGWSGFCGGSAPFSAWLERDELLRALRRFGFGNLRVGFDDPRHPHGPALALIAEREAR